MESSFKSCLYSSLLIFVSIYEWIIYGIAYVFGYPVIKRIMVRSALKADIKIVDSRKVARPWDIIVNKSQERKYYASMATNCSLGLGEGYMDGLWDCKDLFELGLHFQKNEEMMKQLDNPNERLLRFLKFKLFNVQTVERAWEVAQKHYDLGNELHEATIGPSLNYSGAYFKNTTNLEDAQEAKLNLLARKLKLQPGMKILELGCGWGSLAKYLAASYQVSVVGITVGKEGATVAKARCKGLDVEIHVTDFRQLLSTETKGSYDRVVAIEILEHVGAANLFQVVNHCLKQDGIFLNQSIGVVENDLVPYSTFQSDSFVHKYIYPNYYLPSDMQLIRQLNEAQFRIQDWQNLGSHYYKTMVAWRENFTKNWPALTRTYPKYDDKFYRLYNYFLSISAACLKTSKVTLWQIVVTKRGANFKGYESER